MIMTRNPFGQDLMEFNNDTVASRVGSRIRKIRTERGMTQSDLGAKLGLTANRIQKYENGARKPKDDLLKEIARALEVSVLALSDPVTTNFIGAMYALFEMEEYFNIKIEKLSEDKAPAISLTVDFREHLYAYLKEWEEIYSLSKEQFEEASSDDEKEEIIKAYHNWQWTFPRGMTDNSHKRQRKK